MLGSHPSSPVVETHYAAVVQNVASCGYYYYCHRSCHVGYAGNSAVVVAEDAMVMEEACCTGSRLAPLGFLDPVRAASGVSVVAQGLVKKLQES